MDTGFSAFADLVSGKNFVNSSVDSQPATEAAPAEGPEKLRALLLEIQEKVTVALRMLGEPSVSMASLGLVPSSRIEGRVVEGVFDGEGMVGSDGNIYVVPSNYASKSKLVEGDLLKLTITPVGAYIYKQMGPTARTERRGMLVRDGEGKFCVESQGKRWKVLAASVSYFKGTLGDVVSFFVPEHSPSSWAAVESISKQ